MSERRKLPEHELERRRFKRKERQETNKRIDALIKRREEQKERLMELDRERGLTKSDICKVMMYDDLDNAVELFVEHHEHIITRRTTVDEFMNTYREVRTRWISKTYNRGIATRIRASVLVYSTGKLLNVPITYDMINEFFDSSACAVRPYVTTILREYER